jgi:hypothetical protein
MSALGIGVSRQIDFRPPMHIPANDRFASAASPGASAACHLVGRRRKFIAGFPLLRRLGDPKIQRDGIIT